VGHTPYLGMLDVSVNINCSFVHTVTAISRANKFDAVNSINESDVKRPDGKSTNSQKDSTAKRK
jgi:hypothetical protein